MIALLQLGKASTRTSSPARSSTILRSGTIREIGTPFAHVELARGERSRGLRLARPPARGRARGRDPDRRRGPRRARPGAGRRAQARRHRRRPPAGAPPAARHRRKGRGPTTRTGGLTLRACRKALLPFSRDPGVSNTPPLRAAGKEGVRRPGGALRGRYRRVRPRAPARSGAVGAPATSPRGRSSGGRGAPSSARRRTPRGRRHRRDGTGARGTRRTTRSSGFLLREPERDGGGPTRPFWRPPRWRRERARAPSVSEV